MATNETFAERLTELREIEGKKRQEVADSLGITRASLEYYEKGKRKPDIEVLTKLANYYKVSTDYLLGLSDAPTTDRDVQFICDYTGLDMESLKNISKDNIENKIINIYQDKKSYYTRNEVTNPARLIFFYAETFADIYYEVLNKFLQSDYFFSVITNCAYEVFLDYVIDRVLDSEEIENAIDMPDNEYKRLLCEYKSVICRTLTDLLANYEMLHKINLFELQDNIITFAKSLTNIDIAPNNRVEEINKKIAELSELYLSLKNTERTANIVKELNALLDKSKQGGD